jgi:hypothetical protein
MSWLSDNPRCIAWLIPEASLLASHLVLARLLRHANALPLLAPLARPAVKQSVKAALIGYERGREMAALLAETLSDIVAEVQVEMHAQNAAGADGRVES